MRDKIVIIITLVFVLSCGSLKHSKKVNFSFHDGLKRGQIVLRIPENYSLTKFQTGGEGEEYRFTYQDSSQIYISDATGLTTLNDSFIRKSKEDVAKQFLTDSISFSGVNENGNYWLEKKIRNLKFGYFNVLPQKKEVFDKALSPIKIK